VLVAVEDVAAAVWLQLADGCPAAGWVEEPASAAPARFAVARKGDCWAAPSNGYSAVPSADAPFGRAGRWADSARAGSAAPMAGDRCASEAEPAVPDDYCSARADWAQADYWVAPMAGDRCAPAVVRAAPHGCSADSAPADYSAVPMADDRSVPVVESVAPRDCSVQAGSVADDSPAAQAARSPAALPESVVPDDYSLPAGLPVRVAPQAAGWRPDAGSLPVPPAGCLAGSWLALPADYPGGSLPELEWPLSPEALVSPEDSPAHSPDASSAILAAAKAGRDVVPTLAVWRQTQAEVEAALLWRLQDAPRLLAEVLPLVPPC